MESVREEDIALDPIEELRALVDDKINDDVFDSPPATENPTSSTSSVTPLISALRRGSSTISRFLKGSKATEVHLTKTDQCERNAFHYSVNKPDTLKMLVEKFKSHPLIKEALHHEDKNGRTPAHEAAYIGNKKSLEILYEFDNSLIQLRSKISKCSMLHYVVRSSSLVALQFILSKDLTQLDVLDSMAKTAVHYAAKYNQANIMEALIAKGANTTKEDANGQLAIHISASHGFLNVLDILLQNEPGFIDTVDNSGQTALLLASQNGFHEVVLYLLDRGADYSVKDQRDYTAFDWATHTKNASVIEVFLGKKHWKQVVQMSRGGAENCLSQLIKDLPETALKLMNNCISVKDSLQNYEVIYDFFCLESEENKDGCPTFQALSSMLSNKSVSCLSHPLSVKYVNKKWQKRGFTFYTLAIILTLLFHICLMTYTIKIRGTVSTRAQRRQAQERDGTRLPDRVGSKPDAQEMMALRIVLLVIACGMMLKEIIQIFIQRYSYFFQIKHYYQLALMLSVIIFVLPVEQTITNHQLKSGSISVSLSWLNFIQFLQMVPVLGVYILAVSRVFWTLMKILVVVFLFLMSFSTTFYILLAEHDSFNNLGISIVSSFDGMINGLDYGTLFVEEEDSGSFRHLYDLKLTALVVFTIVMSIVVNNTLIGLAVGDTDEVMKSARFEKFRHKVMFVINVERSLHCLIGSHMVDEHKTVSEHPKRIKSKCRKIIDFIYFGQKMDLEQLETIDNKPEETEVNFESHLKNMLAPKLDEIRLTLHEELEEIYKRLDKYQEDADWRKEVEEKMLKLCEKSS